jgi:hypothetical protein
MEERDTFIAEFGAAERHLRAARLDQIEEALRLLACEVAYAERYGECLPLAELALRIADREDPASAALLSRGMEHLTEVLRRLNVVADTQGRQEPSS